MKKIKILLCLCICCSIYLVACKKNNDTGGSNDNNEIQQSISNVLTTNDSLSQYGQLFTHLSLTNDELANGITVLALNNSSLINPVNPDDLKDYIIQSTVSPESFTNGKVFTSITGKPITITVQNGNTYANGVMISVTPVSTAPNYSIYATAGLFITGAAAYDDPHKSEYYIEYYENGVYHSLKGSYITTWPFISANNYPTPVSGNCSYPSFTSYSSGPTQALIAYAADVPFALQINRSNLTSPPMTGEYKISPASYNASQNKNTGTCNLVINGAVFSCDAGDKDSYVDVTVTEVKTDQDLGLEKRGYYRGEFNAILYYTPHNGGAVEKKVITSGRFMAPMGGNETTPIAGTAPTVDRFALLTTGKWFWKLITEADSDYPPCNDDDYIVFKSDNTCDFKDGANQCPDSTNEIDHGDNFAWSLTNNQTVINIPAYEIVWTIVSISDSSLTVSESNSQGETGTGTFLHGN